MALQFEDTALTAASRNGQVKTIELLLEAGADKTRKKSNGKGPLDIARNYAPRASLPELEILLEPAMKPAVTKRLLEKLRAEQAREKDRKLAEEFRKGREAIQAGALLAKKEAEAKARQAKGLKADK